MPRSQFAKQHLSVQQCNGKQQKPVVAPWVMAANKLVYMMTESHKLLFQSELHELKMPNNHINSHTPIEDVVAGCSHKFF